MDTTWAAALGWRLRRHFLAEERAAGVADAVRRVVAVPAWSGDVGVALARRVADPGSARADLTAALTDGRLLTTYSFRGSSQVMDPEVAAPHLALRCAGRQWERSSWRGHYRLEPEDWPRLRAVVREVLADGPLTQAALAAAVARDPAYAHLQEHLAHRSHTLLKPFAWQGDLCLDVTGDALRLRSLASVPGWPGPVPLEEAGPRAVRAYVAAYGPATTDNVHYWLGEGLSAGRRRIDGWLADLRADGTLVTLDVDGTPALCLAEDADDVVAAAPSDDVVLLAGHDPWVLGPGTADPHVVPPAHRARVSRGAPLALAGGVALGTWEPAGDHARVDWFDGTSCTAPVG